MRRFVKFFILILPVSPSGLKLRQVDKTWLLKNEETCRLRKDHFGNGSFSFNPFMTEAFIIWFLHDNGLVMKGLSRSQKVVVKKRSQKITFKLSINLKWHTRFSNKTICKLLLWKTYKYFERLPQRKQVSKFNESCRNQPSFLKSLTIPPKYRPISTLSNFAKLFWEDHLFTTKWFCGKQILQIPHWLS